MTPQEALARVIEHREIFRSFVTACALNRLA